MGRFSAYSAFSAVILSAVTISTPLRHNALKFDLGVMAKVDQQPELKPGCFEVILDLGPVLVSQFAHGLELENDLS